METRDFCRRVTWNMEQRTEDEAQGTSNEERTNGSPLLLVPRSLQSPKSPVPRPQTSPVKVYFVSDLHFGIPNKEESLKREHFFVEWLSYIKDEGAEELYIMGDLFDFWYEYKYVVPKGYIRLLGKLAELSDAGVKLYFFKGNHDMWEFGYLDKELGMTTFDGPIVKRIGSKLFYLAHGDGLGEGDNGYKFIKAVFRAKINQWLFGLIHPDLGVRMGLFFSRRSRLANTNNPKLRDKLDSETQLDEIMAQPLITYSNEYLAAHPDIDFFIYGHWHKPQLIRLTEKTAYANVGDWLSNFTYLEFDGDELKIRRYK